MTVRPQVLAGLLAVATVTCAAPAYATLPIQQWQTAGGARVLFVETHDLPMLDVAVDFPAGSSRDTREKSGLAALTLRMLRLGAEGLEEDQIAERLADVGADIGGRFD
ncbi:MAG TPA: insulinase family protein, partial [Burkholderiales bacterium]|nr:insulinase family protein [Burkholderiales bacterium]